MPKDKRFVESKLVAKEAKELKDRVEDELKEADPEEEKAKAAIEKATTCVSEGVK